MKKAYSIFFAVLCAALGAAGVQYDFSAANSALPELRNGAEIKEGLLTFPKSRSYALVPNSKEMDFSDSGTLMMVVRLRDLAGDPQAHRFFAEKSGSFFFGLTWGKYNISLCDKGRWSIALQGGEMPDENVFIHYAVVIRKIAEKEQGKFGFQMEFYINGERVLSKFHPVIGYKPVAGGGLTINKPGKYGHFKGDVASFSFVKRALSANEVLSAAKSDPRVKIVTPGIVDLPAKAADKLSALEKVSPAGIAAFTAASLRKAAATGVAETKVLRGIAAAEKLLKSAEFVTAFNAAQKDFALLESANGTLFVVLGDAGSSYPVVDLYDPAIKRGVFGARSNSWSLTLDRAGTKNIRVRDFDPGVKITVSDPVKENGVWKFTINYDHQYFRAASQAEFSAAGLLIDLNAEAVDKAVTLRHVLFPRWALAKKSGADFLLTPFMMGKLIAAPIENYSYERDFPCAQNAMQLQAYYSDGGDGVYIAREDPFATACVSGVYGKSHQLFAHWTTQIPLPAANEVSRFEYSGKSAVRLFSGNWFHAAQLYKEFLRTRASWWIRDLPRTDTPEWFRNNSIWILAGVFPSRNEATMLYLREYFEQPFGVHLVGTSTRRHWPNFDRTSIDGFRRTRNLQKAGLKILPYCDPRLYSEEHPDRPGKKGWTPEVESWAVVNAEGKRRTETYGPKCLVLCPQAPGWQQEYLRICSNIAKNGFDGIYHDQLPCGHSPGCYAANHGHRVNDPAYWIRDGYAKLYAKMHERLDRERPGLVHTGEDASDPFLQMIDGYTAWRWVEPNAVALFQTVYAGRIQFTGKLYNHQYPGDWESNFAKAASQVVNAEQLGWITLEDLEAATPFRKYYKVLAHVRKALLEYFNTGSRTEPLKFTRDPGRMVTIWGNTYGNGWQVDSPRVEHSCWQLPDGRRMILFINATESVQRAAVKLPFPAEKIYVCRQSSAAAQCVNTVPEITLPPYGVEVWLIPGKTDNRAEIAAIASQIHRTSTFDEGKSLSVKPVVTQKVPETLTVSTGKMVPVKAAAKYTNTFKRYFANGLDKDTTLILYNDSTVEYKGVELPANTSTIELLAAYDASEAGSKFTVLIDGKPAQTVVLNTPGRYLDFQRVAVKLPETAPGKHEIKIVFNGKSCRFKGWVAR